LRNWSHAGEEAELLHLPVDVLYRKLFDADLGGDPLRTNASLASQAGKQNQNQPPNQQRIRSDPLLKRTKTASEGQLEMVGVRRFELPTFGSRHAPEHPHPTLVVG